MLRSDMLRILDEVAVRRAKDYGGYPDVLVFDVGVRNERDPTQWDEVLLTASADENGRPSVEIEPWATVVARFEAAAEALGGEARLDDLADTITAYHQATTEAERHRLWDEVYPVLDEFTEVYDAEEEEARPV